MRIGILARTKYVLRFLKTTNFASCAERIVKWHCSLFMARTSWGLDENPRLLDHKASATTFRRSHGKSFSTFRTHNKRSTSFRSQNKRSITSLLQSKLYNFHHYKASAPPLADLQSKRPTTCRFTKQAPHHLPIYKASGPPLVDHKEIVPPLPVHISSAPPLVIRNERKGCVCFPII